MRETLKFICSSGSTKYALTAKALQAAAFSALGFCLLGYMQAAQSSYWQSLVVWLLIGVALEEELYIILRTPLLIFSLFPPKKDAIL